MRRAISRCDTGRERPAVVITLTGSRVRIRCEKALYDMHCCTGRDD